MGNSNQHTSAMYALSLSECAHAIAYGGNKRTVLVQGHMGTGKSSLLKELKSFPTNIETDEPATLNDTHVFAYFDCTTKDTGDIALPDLAANDGNTQLLPHIKFLPNAEMGLQHGKPIVLMIDEFGKANPPVRNALMRMMLERSFADTPLPEGSILFATTNLGAEGVGDMVMPHQANRISIITSRKPTATEWIEWGIGNGIHPMVLSFVKEFPMVLQPFTEVKDPKDNVYIYHPRAQETSFVTPRSLEAASDWMHMNDKLPMSTSALTGLLIGTIGPKAAVELMAYQTIGQQLPSLLDIQADPEGTPLPDNVAASCLLTFKALSTLSREWAESWFKYMMRMEKEMQAMFANGVMARGYPSEKQMIAVQDKTFTTWVKDNRHLFGEDDS